MFVCEVCLNNTSAWIRLVSWLCSTVSQILYTLVFCLHFLICILDNVTQSKKEFIKSIVGAFFWSDYSVKGVRIYLISLSWASWKHHWVIIQGIICLYSVEWPLAYCVKNIAADVLISWIIFTWQGTDYEPGQGATMNHRLYHHHHLPPPEQQLLLSNSISKSKHGRCWCWRDPTVCWNLAVYMGVRHCVPPRLAGLLHCLLKSALWGQIKSPSL